MAKIMGGKVLAAGAGEVFFHQMLDAHHAEALVTLGEKERLVGRGAAAACQVVRQRPPRGLGCTEGVFVRRQLQRTFMARDPAFAADINDDGEVEYLGRIDAQDAVQVCQVQHHPAADRHGTAGQAGTGTEGHQRHTVL